MYQGRETCSLVNLWKKNKETGLFSFPALGGRENGPLISGMTDQNVFLTKAPARLFLSYLLPSVSATLVTSVYILADTLMIGRGVGPSGLAALNLLLPIFSVFMGTGILFGVGGSVLFSVSRGRGEERLSKEYFTAALLLILGVGIVYILVLAAYFDPITTFLGKNQATRGYVWEYGRFLMAVPQVFLLSAFLQAFVRNDGAPRLAMAGVVAGGILNVILDYVFIFLMDMGMSGAAFATVLGSALTVLVLCTHFLSEKNTLRLIWPETILKKCGQIIFHGFSSFLLEESSGVIILLFNRQLLAYVGEQGVTVYGIISNSALVVQSVNNGICQAVQPILAANFGAGFSKRVAAAARYGMITAAVSGIVFTCLGLCFPEGIAGLFVELTPEIRAMAKNAVSLYFLSFLFLGINMVAATYFQSVMRPGLAMGICLLRGFVLSSILVMILPALWGVDGIWGVMLITEALTLGICIWLKRDL